MNAEKLKEFDTGDLLKYGEQSAHKLVSAGYFPARREARRIRSVMRGNGWPTTVT